MAKTDDDMSWTASSGGWPRSTLSFGRLLIPRPGRLPMLRRVDLTILSATATSRGPFPPHLPISCWIRIWWLIASNLAALTLSKLPFRPMFYHPVLATGDTRPQTL